MCIASYVKNSKECTILQFRMMNSIFAQTTTYILECTYFKLNSDELYVLYTNQ
jgi:hypothetical protein